MKVTSDLMVYSLHAYPLRSYCHLTCQNYFLPSFFFCFFFLSFFVKRMTTDKSVQFQNSFKEIKWECWTRTNSFDRLHLPWVPYLDQANGVIRSQNPRVKSGLTFGMKRVRKHLTQLMTSCTGNLYCYKNYNLWRILILIVNLVSNLSQWQKITGTCWLNCFGKLFKAWL
jgi:hypothetical protein